MDRRVKLVSVEGIQKRKTPDKKYVSTANRLVSKSPSERRIPLSANIFQLPSDWKGRVGSLLTGPAISRITTNEPIGLNQFNLLSLSYLSSTCCSPKWS